MSLHKNMENQEFTFLIEDIICSEEFQNMKSWRHHIRGSVYEHSIKVAYLCYKHHKRFQMAMDIKEFVRGAVLHDYYLYDLHDGKEEHKYHWFKHPKEALKNAMDKYPDLTDIQQEMISRHMFPLTLKPPKTAAAWAVCFYDKVAAVSDCLGKR